MGTFYANAVLLYVRDLGILELWYLCGVLEPIFWILKDDCYKHLISQPLKDSTI